MQKYTQRYNMQLRFAFVYAHYRSCYLSHLKCVLHATLNGRHTQTFILERMPMILYLKANTTIWNPFNLFQGALSDIVGNLCIMFYFSLLNSLIFICCSLFLSLLMFVCMCSCLVWNYMHLLNFKFQNFICFDRSVGTFIFSVCVHVRFCMCQL